MTRTNHHDVQIVSKYGTVHTLACIYALVIGCFILFSDLAKQSYQKQLYSNVLYGTRVSALQYDLNSTFGTGTSTVPKFPN